MRVVNEPGGITLCEVGRMSAPDNVRHPDHVDTPDIDPADDEIDFEETYRTGRVDTLRGGAMAIETEDGPDTTLPERGSAGVSDGPRYLNPVDAPDFDSPDDELDWEEIYQSTQPDYEAGRYCFNSEDYPSHEEAMIALGAWIHSIGERVRREAASVSARDAEG
jgi:hypothetical protein